MQIKLSQQNPNFEQIRLSEAELSKAKNIYHQVTREPYNHRFSLRMFDLFEPHLNNEVYLKDSRQTKARKAFAINLYHKFFDILETIKNKEQPFEAFFNHLNNYSDKFILKDLEDNQTYPLDFNVTVAKKTAIKICEKLGISHDTYLKFAQKNPTFQHLTINRLNQEIEDLRNYFGFNEKEFDEIIKRSPYALTNPSASIINESKLIMKTLEIESMDKYKELIENNTDTLCLTNDKLNERIDKLCEFLGTDNRNNIAHMIKSQPRLSTSPFEWIVANFDKMQEYLNVDKEKMIEITEMAPIVIRNSYKTTQKNYEDVCKTLNISMDIFRKWANLIPAIYRITPSKLDVLIDFISKELDLPSNEAKKYISRNLILLSYRFVNIAVRPKENFKTLNKDYGIDSETYRDMLLKNAWIMGSEKEFTKNNLLNLQNYFNVDKKTFTEMIKENPTLITTPINYIEKYKKDTSKLLNIEEKDFLTMCIKYPLLATRPVKLLQENITHNSRIVGVSENRFIEMSKRNPIFLIEKFE